MSLVYLKLMFSTIRSTSSMAGIQSLDRSNRTCEKGIAYEKNVNQTMVNNKKQE
jgi:hypothetical protein